MLPSSIVLQPPNRAGVLHFQSIVYTDSLLVCANNVTPLPDTSVKATGLSKKASSSNSRPLQSLTSRGGLQFLSSILHSHYTLCHSSTSPSLSFQDLCPSCSLCLDCTSPLSPGQYQFESLFTYHFHPLSKMKSLDPSISLFLSTA